MKKSIKKSLQICALLFSVIFYAQDYKIAGGLFVDVGTGEAAFGPHTKFFVSENFSIQPAVLFMDGSTVIGADFSYNDQIPGAPGLMWNVGVGPQLMLYDGDTHIMLRPSAGLEYTIKNAPINLFFDWRPALEFDNGTDFTAGRFGVGLRFVFKR